jgi:protein-disulfide isomerase
MWRSFLRPAIIVGLLAGVGSAQNNKSTLDKAALEAYVRHLFVMPPTVQVQVGDPKPSSDLPGYSDVTVSASLDSRHQDFQFLVSKDGSKIIQGTVYDTASNPFKHDLDKLKTDGAPSLGTQGAPVVLVEFSDFECPHCQKEATILRENLVKSYPTQVHFYYKTLPLESIHPWARAGAIASRCVYRQNKDAFWGYHDWIFDHQDEITPENLKDKVLDWAKGQKGIDPAQLQGCIVNKATEAEVNRDMAEAKDLGVDSTPTLFINGRKMPGAAEWPTLQAVIDNEIEYQKTAKNAGEDCGCSVKLDLPGAPQGNTPAISPLKSSKK